MNHSRRIHLRATESLCCNRTACGLTVPAGRMDRITSDLARVNCAKCQVKNELRKAKAE